MEEEEEVSTDATYGSDDWVPLAEDFQKRKDFGRNLISFLEKANREDIRCPGASIAEKRLGTDGEAFTGAGVAAKRPG